MMKKKIALLAVLASVLATVGCTTSVSRGLTAQGVATELVFPDEGHMVVKGGTRPAVERLRPLAIGMTKPQLRALVGSPQFREGFAAREWDYLFQLEDTSGNPVRCRFKVLFDSEAIARNMYWAPSQCARLIEVEPAPVAASKPVVQQSPAPVFPRHFALQANTLFASGRWSEYDLTSAGRLRLQQIAAELLRGAKSIRAVQVVGHADRMGDDWANQQLSQRRADTVRSVLVGYGVPAAGITAEGRGEREPLSECSDRQSRPALMACLAPDRRVEIVALPAA
jgi:outer membrane protein OmpA-like peptidoglycan-associated protein